MATRHDVKGYNAGAMLLHWAIALCILLQLAGGFAMMRLDVVPDAMRFSVFQWHKTIGLLVLALTIARIAWRVLNPPPAHAAMSALEAAAANVVHVLFYALMLLVPLAGWVMVSVSPTAIPTLLMMSQDLPWPHLPLPAAWHAETAESAARTLHTWLAYTTAGLLVLHVAGALKHSLVDRQPSLSRMVPSGRLQRQPTSRLAVPVAAGLAALFLAGGVAVGRGGIGQSGATSTAALESMPVATAGWTLDKAASKITFETAFSGKTLVGAVGRWNAAITFDPEKPEAASAQVTVDPSSITVDDPFVGGSVSGPDGFDVAAHPVVTIRLDRFERTGETYLAHGMATIKDKAAPLDLPFSFTPAPGGGAHVVGTAVLDRIALGLGLQNDATAQWLGKDVTVHLDLKADPARPAPAS